MSPALHTTEHLSEELDEAHPQPEVLHPYDYFQDDHDHYFDHDHNFEQEPMITKNYPQQQQPLLQSNHHNSPTTTTSTAASTTANEFIRFTISGFIGTVIFYVFYESLFSFLLPNISTGLRHSDGVRSVVAWVIGYMFSIWIQFELHSRIVFQQQQPSQNGGVVNHNNSANRIKQVSSSSSTYWRRLGMTYVAYSFSMVFSTVVIYVCSSVLMLNHQIGWVVSNVSVGILNYFVVRSFMAQ